MPKSVVKSPEVVEGKGLYSQCTRVGDLLLIAGQVAWDAQGNVVGPGDAAAQARRCFEAIQSLVEAAGGSMGDVAKVNMYLANVSDASLIGPIRKEFFSPPYPAWTTVAVKALVDPALLVEVEAVAYVGDSS